jgi:lipid-binding SYLF domain-containing protein
MDYDIEMRVVLLAISILACAAPVAAEGTQERLSDAASLFNEIMATPDRSIPQDLLRKSACIVLVPGVKRAAFVFGGKYGRGFLLCRHSSGTGWGPPGAVRMEGGSFGFQIGVSSTDVVLLVMNPRGMKKLLKSKFTLGGDASVAAGPIGRDTSAQTDAMMTAEILSWSRSKGLFAGVSLEGATLRNDIDENEAMYGKRWTNQDVVNSGAKPPKEAADLLRALNKFSMKKG